MAKFLTTTGIASGIEEIIRKASSQFVLVTPYLKLSKIAEQRLKDANKKKLNMIIIYGKSELSSSQSNLLQQLDHLELYYCDNLHAKCYHNGRNMIIASMNLYEFSEKNNREMGVLIDSAEDKEIFEDALDEIASILSVSELKKKNRLVPGIIEGFSEVRNFHLPLLLATLQSEYHKHEFLMGNDEIDVNFPGKLRLQLDSRLILKFESQYQLKIFKSSVGDIFEGTKHFWNERTLHLYLPDNKKVKVCEEDQEYILDYFMGFIRKIWVHCK